MTKNPKFIKAVYDNGGKTIDRYTIVLPDGDGCLSLSDDPNSPQGFSQFGECVEGSHLGKKISWNKLPKNVRDSLMTNIDYIYVITYCPHCNIDI